MEADVFLGPRTVIFPAPALAGSKAWFERVLGVAPSFDEPFYVGFEVGGYELGLLPMDPAGGPLAGGPVTYWGVPDADVALAALLAAGAAPDQAVSEVSDAIRVATVREPGGSVLGIIENPHFRLPDAPPAPAGDGPGR